MPSNVFESLQKRHQEFLQRQLSSSKEDKELSSDKDKMLLKDVKQYIIDVRAAGEIISLIEEREQLHANLRYWANYIYGIEGVFPDTNLPGTASDKKLLAANSYRWLALPGTFLIIVLLLVTPRIFDALSSTSLPTATVLIQTATVLSTPMVTEAKYGFDRDKDTMGWVPERTRLEDGAVINVQQQIKFGSGSLELLIELIGNDSQKSKGEVFVDLSSNPPLGETKIAPLDLNGIPITMLVYVPSEAIGIPSNPNGIQIFVRDSSDRGQYGVWVDLTFENTNGWTSVTWRPSLKTSLEEEEKGASTDDGFDPSRINKIGLKIGAASAFNKDFTGSIWIDQVTWP